MNETNGNILRKRILESFQEIEYKRFIKERISTSVMNDLRNDINRFSKLFENSKESIFLTGLYNNLVQFCSDHINESGFVNPFRSGISKELDDKEKSVTSFKSLGSDYYNKKNPNDFKLLGVKIWNPDKLDKTYYSDGTIKAGRHFSKGDVVEKCPTRYLTGQDRYSKAVRDFSFPIDKEQNLYAIPFGKAIFYKNSVDTGRNGNVDYEFIESPNESNIDGYIVIKALRNIRANEELILKSDEHDFENVIKDEDFDYIHPKRDVSILGVKLL